MSVPRVYRRESEKALVSFTLANIASGKGYVRYYGTASKQNASYALVPNVLDSDNYATTAVGGAPTTSYAICLFDLPFDVSQTLEGDMYINWTYEGSATSGVTGVTIAARKLTAAGTATILGTKAGVVLTSSQSKRELAILKIAKTTFKKTDVLRVTASFAIIAGDGSTAYLYHDPTNRKASNFNDINITLGGGITSDTTFIVDVPFRIDL